MTFTLRARRVLTGEAELSPGHVRVEDGVITSVTAEPPGGPVTDLGDHDLLPGLVDLHSDCWYQRARPRPSARFPLGQALVMLDTEVVSWGITTHFTCLALQDDTTAGRTLDEAAEAAAIVAAAGGLRADHRTHLRVEATMRRLDVVAELAALPRAGMLSYMDHTPGQGQFRREADWRAYYAGTGEPDLDALLAGRRARQPHTDATRKDLAALAVAYGLALASHDDDTPGRAAQAHALGAVIAEFPVTAGAAHRAHELGLTVVMGAPNAMRGGSHVAGNLSARDTLAAGHLGALTSDYHPPSLLGAIYCLADAGLCDLATSVGLATAGPARAAGLTDRGVLRPGARADLVAVTRKAGLPVATQTWIAGEPAFGF
ncbi:alpha-D-ribose 1-methylphosphonate 5-triphosphate diphosphatase [Streptosporangium oxazolinicum]|uniref:Alpha-D-ribose 1-methylphosphonate 5-triphosphate diphosphatase n=1 Tax=Streptosporangium oxazolinicum TaxID=909287 RepID=A0ABP8BDD3_9ACTN